MTESFFPSLEESAKRFLPDHLGGHGHAADGYHAHVGTSNYNALPSLSGKPSVTGGNAEDDLPAPQKLFDSLRRLAARPPSNSQTPQNPPVRCRIRRPKANSAGGKSALVFADRPRPTTIVFIPGDIQTLRPKQMEEAGYGEFVKYSIHSEAMLRRLSEKHQANVVVIRPSHVCDGSSLYSTLLECDKEGDVKSYSPTGGAAMKLRTTLCEIAEEFPEIKQDYILVGFSRGALVLNQLLTEAANPEHPDSVLISGFFNHVSVIHHVDAGNEGPSFPNEQTAQGLATVFLPHQVFCIHQSTYHLEHAQQMSTFVNSLRLGEASAECSNTSRSSPHGIASMLGVYNYNFHDRSISEHFKLLENYKTPELEGKSAPDHTLLPHLPNLPHIPIGQNEERGVLSCSGRMTRSSHTRTPSRNNKVITPKCCSDGIGSDFLLPQVPLTSSSEKKLSSTRACGLPALPPMRSVGR